MKKIWDTEEFWPSYEWLKKKDAIDFLIETREWEVRWAYEYNWEPIDLVRWKTNAETNGKWYWLSKIEEKHPDLLNRLDDVIENTKGIEDENWLLIFDNWLDRVVVMPHWKWNKKRWILTAYSQDGRFVNK